MSAKQVKVLKEVLEPKQQTNLKGRIIKYSQFHNPFGGL